MNTKSLMKWVAEQLPTQGINMQWDIRGEIGTEEVDENKTLIAVCHCIGQNELIHGNFTYRLNCALTGQILLNALTQEDIDNEVNALFQSMAVFVKGLKYTEADSAVIMQGTCGNVETETDNLYFSFAVPFTLYTQF